MSLFDRLVNVVRSNLNNMLQEAEDPERIIEATIEELEQQVISQRQSIAGAIALEKRTERQSKQYKAQAQEWYRRAQLALVQKEEQLAKDCLQRRQAYLQQAEVLDKQITSQLTIITQLKEQLRLLETKVTEIKLKKDLYLAKYRSANTSQTLAQLDNSEVLDKIEQKIFELEAQTELNRDPLEAKFQDLETEEIKRLKAELENL
ncbi:MAG: PspA/IM30 family protein [Gloeocapsa sp. DLM2.Bin57]|nr:MAG: PspA/IM30 family protein [Gloeocapsa sp. DLM2.Bin57]